MVCFPSLATKQRSSLSYTVHSISTVRSFSERQYRRRPSITPTFYSSDTLHLTLKGLSKIAAKPQEPKRPVLFNHLRTICGTLDLQQNKHHMVLLVIWTTCWQVILRLSDVLRTCDRKNHQWSPDHYMHRDNLRVSLARDNDGRPVAVKQYYSSTRLNRTKREWKMNSTPHDIKRDQCSVCNKTYASGGLIERRRKK